MTEKSTVPYDEVSRLGDVQHSIRSIKKGRPAIANRKQVISLRLDRDVLEYFKAGGKGYQTRINQVLADYVAKQTAKS